MNLNKRVVLLIIQPDIGSIWRNSITFPLQESTLLNAAESGASNREPRQMMYRLYIIHHSKSVDVAGICRCMCVYTAYDHVLIYVHMYRLYPTLRGPIEGVLRWEQLSIAVDLPAPSY